MHPCREIESDQHSENRSISPLDTVIPTKSEARIDCLGWEGELKVFETC